MEKTTAKERKTKKSKKSGTVFLIIILLLAVLVIGAFIISNNSRDSVGTETVLSGTAEDKIQADGYIIRGEYVMNSPADGIISFRADEGKRVSKGSTVAVIFTGDVSDDVKNELSSIHQRMNEIEGSSAEKNLYAGDAVGGASQILNDIDAISEAAYRGKTSAVPNYKDNITRLIRKNNKDEAHSQTTYEQLSARKKELEGSISGNSVALYAPISGVLTSHTDGYEEYFGVGCLSAMTPEYLEQAPSVKTEAKDMVEKDTPCLKLINNYEWFVAANVDEKWAEDLKVGQYVSLRFNDISSEKMGGNIFSISEPSKGKVAVVVRSSGLFNGMYTLRNAEVEIVRMTYKGFKVSKEAVHIDKDGSFYVFVNSEGVVRRRNIEILYSDDSYAIIKEDNSASNNLLLYDEVIVRGNHIEEGDSL